MLHEKTSLIVCIYIWKNTFLFLMRISCEDHRLLSFSVSPSFWTPPSSTPHRKKGSTKHLPKLCPTLEFDVFLRFSMDFYKNHADSITFPGFFLSFSLSVPWTFGRSFLSGRPGPSPGGPPALKVRTFFAVEDHLQRFLQLISTSGRNWPLMGRVSTVRIFLYWRDLILCIYIYIYIHIYICICV